MTPLEIIFIVTILLLLYKLVTDIEGFKTIILGSTVGLLITLPILCYLTL